MIRGKNLVFFCLKNQMKILCLLHLTIGGTFGNPDPENKYEFQSVAKTKTFLQGEDFAKLRESKYSKLLQTPLNETHYFNNAPLEDLSQWHIHRFSPSSEDLGEKSQEGLDEEAELIESPEGSKVILHCFDCDSEPQIWRSADGEQREKFFFHKVRVDTPYDPFTKRPYHHSILAVKAFPSMTKVRDREEDTANKTSSGELQYYKDQLHINHTSKPYFTVKNNSNIYHINSINYKSFITQNPDPYLEASDEDSNIEGSHSAKNHLSLHNRNHHKYHKNTKHYHSFHNQHHNHHKGKHHKHHRNEEKSFPFKHSSKSRSVTRKEHFSLDKNFQTPFKNKDLKISHLNDFPEQLHYLHRWLLRLDHQRYQRHRQQDGPKSKLLTAPFQLRNS